MEFEQIKRYFNQDRVERLKTHLRKMFKKRKRREDLVDDALQDGFLRILESARKGISIEDPEAYVVRIVQNGSIDASRQRVRRGQHIALEQMPEDYLVDASPPIDEVLSDRQRQKWVRNRLLELDGRTRAIFVYVRLQQHSYSEAAVQFGVSKATVHRELALACFQLGIEQPRDSKKKRPKD